MTIARPERRAKEVWKKEEPDWRAPPLALSSRLERLKQAKFERPNKQTGDKTGARVFRALANLIRLLSAKLDRKHVARRSGSSPSSLVWSIWQ